MLVRGRAVGGNIAPDLGFERCPGIGRPSCGGLCGFDEYAVRLTEDVLPGQQSAKPVGGSMPGLRFVTM